MTIIQRALPEFPPRCVLRAIRVAVLILPGLPTLINSPAAAEDVDYNRDVRPILSERCVTCHGPDEHGREADLRLDIADGARDGLIVPGDAAASEILDRITSDDPDLRMPPPDAGAPLSQNEVATLKQWINNGARFDKHWSFEPLPRSVPIPEVEHSDSLTPLDHFVADRLKTEGLPFQSVAERPLLIRRMSFAVTGLPPSEEIMARYSGPNAASLAELADELLQSPAFGEHFAADWMDAARYADTYGYQNDKHRDVWPWRDWVIQSFNNNRGWDNFLTWQLAGDLLPNPTREQRLATAFNRLHRQTNEGGSIEDEFRKEYVADRVHTFGTTFLGLTLECCRCHSHKFDPVTHAEYYGLASYFNNIDESGLYSHFTNSVPTPAMLLPSETQEQQLRKLDQQIAQRRDALASTMNSANTRFEAWLNSTEGLHLSVPEPRLALTFDDPNSVSGPNEQIDGPSGKAVRLTGDDPVNTKVGNFSRHTPFTVALQLRVPELYERAVIWHRSRAWTDAGSRGYELLVEDGYLSAALIHFYPGNALRVISAEPLPVDKWHHVAVTWDGSGQAAGLKLYVDGQLISTKIVRDKLTRNITGGGGDHLAIGQRFRDRGLKGGDVDDFHVYDKTLCELQVQELFAPGTLEAIAERGPQALSISDRRLLLEYFLCAEDQESVAARDSVLESLRDSARLRDGIPEIMVMEEMRELRPTHVLTRGAYDQPEEPVSRRVPAALWTSSEQEHPKDRLELARWLTSHDHPLTARVTVNRIWRILWGTGLVRTPEDFGRQGDIPEHPELLDYLAVRFVESGWDVKELVRTIVLSRTWQQSSEASETLLQQDPNNRLLARGPQRRLTAEMLRDAALTYSGLLVDQVGGPSVKPWQPAGLWKEKSGGAYKRDVGAGSHRRSLYTYWKRTSPPPAMMTLDAPSREVCIASRQPTSTPLQFLVLLNDPQFMEAAVATAVLGYEAGSATSGQFSEETAVRFLARRIWTRDADDAETAALTALYQEQLQIYSAAPDEATKLLEVGDYRVPETVPQTQAAALAMVAQVLQLHDSAVTLR